MRTKLAVLTLAALFTGSNALAHSFGAPAVQSKDNPFGVFVYEILGATPHVLATDDAARRAQDDETFASKVGVDDRARAAEKSEQPARASK